MLPRELLYFIWTVLCSFHNFPNWIPPAFCIAWGLTNPWCFLDCQKSLFLECIWKRSSRKKHVPSSIKWKLDSVERWPCCSGLWMKAEPVKAEPVDESSPVLASTSNPTHHVQRVHKRTHLWREKEDATGLRAERGRMAPSTALQRAAFLARC